MTKNLLTASDEYLSSLGPGSLARSINDAGMDAKWHARRVHDYVLELRIFTTIYDAVMALTDTSDIYWNAMMTKFDDDLISGD